MADIFCTIDTRNLLKHRFVAVFGDSNLRAIYKDLVLLIKRNEIISQTSLKKKGEPSYEGDSRTVFEGMTKGRHYVESREYSEDDFHIEYHFITKCYNDKIEEFMKKIKEGQTKAPDVIIMNSCVWDISRWGPSGVSMYKENMQKLMNLLNQCLPKSSLFIWATAPPVSTEIKCSLLVPQLNFIQTFLRFEVMEANLFCRQLVVAHGYDVLDTHFHLRMQIHRREKDGLHYGPLPVRLITNLMLTHISLAWDVPLPGNCKGIALERIINEAVLRSSKDGEVKLPTVPNSLLDADRCNNNYPKIIPKDPTNVTQRNGHFPKYRHLPILKRPQLTQWHKDVLIGRLKPMNPTRYQTLENKYWNNNNRVPFVENYTCSNYQDFDQVQIPGPIRTNNKYPNRQRPY